MKLKLSVLPLEETEREWIDSMIQIKQTAHGSTRFGFTIWIDPQFYEKKIERFKVRIEGLDSTYWNDNDWIKNKFYVEYHESSKIDVKQFSELIDIYDPFTCLWNPAISVSEWVCHLSSDPVKMLNGFIRYQKVNQKGPIKIAVVGMKHCGSTLLYNILRVAMKRTFKSVNNNNSLDSDYDAYVWKSHEVPSFMESDRSWKVITTIRDIRDVSISGFLRFHFRQSINPKENMEKEIECYGMRLFLESMWENIMLHYNSLKVNPIYYYYEEYKKNKKEMIQRLFELLSIDVPEEMIESIIKEAEEIREDDTLTKNLAEYQFVRSTTKGSTIELLTKDHNTSGGQTEKFKTFFSKLQNDIILEDLWIRSFLEDHGYIAIPSVSVEEEVGAKD